MTLRERRPTRRDMLTGVVAAGAGLTAGSLLGADVGALAPGGHTRDRRREDRERSSAASGHADRRVGSRRLIWSVDVDTQVASLSFDDGPDPQFTPRVLEALAKANVRATFMVMGWSALQHPGLLKEIVAAGHEIGNHTWSHEDLTFQTARQTQVQITRARDAISSVVQAPIVGFRPPRGAITGAALATCAELRYDVWLWSVTRGPGGPGTPREVAAWVGSHTQAGDIVDLHDSIGWHVRDRTTSQAAGLIERREVEIRALPEILSRISDRGISLVPMGELDRRRAASAQPRTP